jgi:DNA polymerase III delta prime subunit
MEENKQWERMMEGLKKNYRFIFNTEESKQVLSDLEKRCHYTLLLM